MSRSIVSILFLALWLGPSIGVAQQSVPTPADAEQIVETVPSPDGSAVLIVAHFGPNSRRSRPPARSVLETDIWLYDRTDGEMRRLTTNHLSREPTWAPDGERIAYASKGSLVVEELSSGERTTLRKEQLPDKPRNEYDYESYGNPDWGPVERYMIFSSTNGGVQTWYLYDFSLDRVIWSKTGGADLRWTDQGGLVYGDEDQPRLTVPAEDIRLEACLDIDAYTNRR